MLALVQGALRKSAVGSRDDPLTADRAGEIHDPLRDRLGMLDHGGRVRDHAGNEYLALRELHVLPHTPLVRVTGCRRLDRIALRLDPEHEVDDVAQTEVVDVRPLPAAP